MTRIASWFLAAALCISPVFAPQSFAQRSTTPTSGSAIVPSLVQFSGTLTDLNDKPITEVAGVSFSLYKDEQGGVPLWAEIQNVHPDETGHYSVALGSTTSTGLPTNLFVSGESRYLGVRIEGQNEQPRILFLSVPYALKAGDAETIGGLPPSAFMLAAPPPGAGSSVQAAAGAPGAPPPSGAITGTGTVNFIPLWDSTSDIISSAIFQSGSGTTAKIGINTKTPSTALDVKGGATVRGTLTLPSNGTATAAAGKNSQPENLSASAFNSNSQAAVNEMFQWMAEPTANDSPTPSATLNLLFGSGGSAPAETGLKVANNGVVTFNSAQTFPGTGTITGVTTASGSGLTGGGSTGSLGLSLVKTCSTGQVLQWNATAWVCASATNGGTITGVTAGTDLTGGGTSGAVTLNLDITKVPQLGSSNSFAGTIAATGDLNVDSTSANAGSYTPGLRFGASGTGEAISSARVAGSPNLDGIDFYTNFKNRMSVTNKGFVGVGSTTPSSLLTASGSEATASGDGAAVEISNTATGGGNWYLRAGATGTNTPAGGFSIANDSAYWLSINTKGQVGIGTNSAQATLDVNLGDAIVRGSDNFKKGGDFANLYVGDTAHDIQAIFGGGLAISTFNKSNAMYIADTTGNVGIGNSAPTHALDVAGTGNFTGLVTFSSAQTFPNTISGVTAGTGLTGGGTSGTVTLNLDTTKIPQLNASNTFTQNQTIAANLSTDQVAATGVESLGDVATDDNDTNSATLSPGLKLGGFGSGEGLSSNRQGGKPNQFGIDFYTSSINKMSLTNAGQLGIGTTAPTSSLEIVTANGGHVGSSVTVTNNATGSGTAASYDFNSYPPSYGSKYNPTARMAATDDGDFSSNILFSANIDGNVNQGMNTTMSITSGGLVGVNTASPASRLQVTGSEPAHDGKGAAVEISNTATGGGNWYLRTGATGNSTPAGGFSLATDSAYYFTITSTGKVGLGTNNNQNLTHNLSMGDGAYEDGGAWTNASDRNLKEGFAPVDGADLLSKLNAIPMQTWKYKAETGSVRHLGPMAQDFRAAFALGQDDKHISTVDEGGVALAAVQELYRQGLTKDATIRQQREQIQNLTQQVEQLQAGQLQVAALETELANLETQFKTIQTTLRQSGRTDSTLLSAKAGAPSMQH